MVCLPMFLRTHRLHGAALCMTSACMPRGPVALIVLPNLQDSVLEPDEEEEMESELGPEDAENL